VKPHTTRLPKQQEDQKGIRGERGGGSVTLLGKRAIRRGERGWMLTRNTQGVEFSIAGCVEEIIRDPNPTPFFSFFTFFTFFIMRSLFLGTRSFVQRSLWKEQNLEIKTYNKRNHLPSPPRFY